MDGVKTHSHGGGLTLVAQFEELAVCPVGRALAGDSFLSWCYSPRLGGTVHFGQRGASDAAVLVRMYGLVGHRALRLPLRRVVDGREFSNVDDDAWSMMVGRVGPRIDALRGIIERQAIIVMPGPDGVRVSGLLPALGPGDPFRIFEDAAEAYAWADPDDGPAAHAAVEQLRSEIGGTARVVSAARAWIRNNLRTASVTACGNQLGQSRRSLQRHLASAGVSFRALVSEVRVEAARALLLEGDGKIASIAHTVGCSSASQLGTLLRRAGESPPSAIRSTRGKSH